MSVLHVSEGETATAEVAVSMCEYESIKRQTYQEGCSFLEVPFCSFVWTVWNQETLKNKDIFVKVKGTSS